MSKQKPLILHCCVSFTGHLMPNLQVAQDLIRRGYDVTFMGTPSCRDRIEAAGCRYSGYVGLAAHCIEGMATYMKAYPDILTMRRDNVDPTEILIRILEISGVDLIPSQLESARIAAAEMNRREPDREIVLVCDSWWWGILPLKMGQQLLPPFLQEEGQPELKPVKSLGISIIPSMFCSADSGPGFLAMGYDPSPEGREARRVATQKIGAMKSRETGNNFVDQVRWLLRGCGVMELDAIDKLLASAHPNGSPPFVFEASYVVHDTTLQMCIPQLEWPISDRPKNVKFGGTLPLREMPKNFVMPSWMDEIRENGKPGEKVGRKRVIVTAQGTVDYDHRNLVVPTIKAFADDDSVIVVAILCFRGANLDAVFDSRTTNGTSEFKGFGYLDHNKPAEEEQKPPLPANARVIDYMPFDAVLPYADVFVSRSGYGGLQHAVSNGVPTVQGGEGLDKPDIALRMEHVGMGLRLRGAQHSEPITVKGLVTRILEDPTFRERAQEMKREAEKFGALDVVERELRALWEN